METLDPNMRHSEKCEVCKETLIAGQDVAYTDVRKYWHSPCLDNSLTPFDQWPKPQRPTDKAVLHKILALVVERGKVVEGLRNAKGGAWDIEFSFLVSLMTTLLEHQDHSGHFVDVKPGH